MIELPESVTIARQLEAAIKDKTVVNVTAAACPHKFAFYQDNPETYHDTLLNLRVTGVNAIGGYVEIGLESHNVILGEDLVLRYMKGSEKPPARHQLLLEFDDGAQLAATVRMYGALYVVKAGNYTTTHHQQAHDKPSPLVAAFSLAYFETLMQNLKPTLSLKAFLATEQRVPGLGNGVLQDILFNARLNPKTKVKTLKSNQAEALFNSIKNTLADMSAKNGRDTEMDVYGNYGGYNTILSVKTYPNLCPACGNAVTKQAYMGGTVYFCSNCQPL